MGFLQLLKFSLLFVDFLAWIPFWSSVKLVAVFWLVFPRFHGSCYAYRSFVRPYLVVGLQEVIDNICKPKEDSSRAKERFLEVADKYIEENGFEALEKLIASKGSYMMILKEPDSSQIGTRVMKQVEENVTVGSKEKDKEMLEVLHRIESPEAKQIDARVVEAVEKHVEDVSKTLKEPAQKGKEMLEDLYTIASPEAKKVPHPRLLTNASRPPKQTFIDTASAKTNDTVITPPPENEQLEKSFAPPLKKIDPEWACDICQLTVNCEKNLSDHLQGKKHKSKCKSLNIISNHLDAPEEVTTDNNAVQNAVRIGSKFELRCDVCDLKLISAVHVEPHFNGKRHSTNLRRLEKIEGVVVS